MAKKSSKKAQSLEIPKIIIFIAKFLQFFSLNLASRFAAKIFVSPIKYKIPRRELDMDRRSIQSKLLIPAINKSIMVYKDGDFDKKALLIHGWNGRGTQLVKFADELLKNEYSIISFDAPAHGKSNTKTTLMPEFIACILEIEKKYGPFEFAIGHSLGGMSLLNATKQGLQVKKIITIGSGDVIYNILTNFVNQLQLKNVIALKMQQLFENEYQLKMEVFSAHNAAKNIQIPALIVHCKNDYEVPYTCAENIVKHLKNGELFSTTNLGHRKILGDKIVLEKCMNFLFK